MQLRRALTLAAMLGCAAAPVSAAPFLPKSDQQLLETLPTRATDPRAREMQEMRRGLATHPADLDAAVRLAHRYYDEAAAEGDPRYVGYAQAALGPWWEEQNPPVKARLMRAILLQFGHQFDPAVSDLEAVLKADPDNGEAWAWLAAIRMVQARYPEARDACKSMSRYASPLIGTSCIANVDSVTGHAAQAAQSIRTAMRDSPHASPAELLWALTRLAEIEERRGEFVLAETAFKQALALGIVDGYLEAAYADFLLDRGRPAEVMTLLKDRNRSDLLLLRLALAAKAADAPTRAAWQDDLTSRFDAARLRGDTLHQKEESRYVLQLLGQKDRALTLATANYALQREPADARILLEAAVAARQPSAAEPVVKWMSESGIESVALQRLAQQLKGGQ